ncbi:phage tail protein [Ancylobacter sp. A5.8]|uniref:phage tail-collar fiber domain-containing protein n=1 Tax=Ancylobacter gelatini TaxID=2919920 RepID=UPI001F4E918E|nr:phage tail protein [Ancylobacter gelatini]
MSQLYYGLVTNTGLAKLAASAAGGPSLTLSAMAFGDGGGAETAPTPAATGLVNERYRALLVEKYPHPTNPSILYVEGIIPPGVGGWTLREAGIYDADGDLIVIAKMPALNVALISEGASTEGVVRLPIVFDSASSVQILIDPTVLLATQGWVLERVLARPFITVDSATITVPPATPSAHALYLVPAGATGAWAGQGHTLAYYLGGWRFHAAPIGKRVAASDTGKVYRRTAAGWEALWVEAEVSTLLTAAGRAAPHSADARLVEVIRAQSLNYRVAGGSANALTVALAPAPVPALNPALTGMPLRLRIGSNNTGPATLNAGPGALPIVTPRGVPIAQGDLIADAIVTLICTGTSWMLVGPAYSEFPLRQSVSPVLWVRPDGNDANNGSANTAAKAFQTIAAAVRYGASNFYLPPGVSLIVRLGVPGTYAAPGETGFNGGTLAIIGDPANPSAYLIAGAGSTDYAGVLTAAHGDVLLQGVLVQNTAAICSALASVINRNLDIQNVVVTAAVGASPSLLLASGGTVNIREGCSAVGSAQSLFTAANSGAINLLHNFTITGVQSYVGALCVATDLGRFSVRTGSVAVLGSTVSTPRYYANLNGIINVAGNGPNYFPGTIAGAVNEGGRYV